MTNNMINLQYFKITFISVAAGLAGGLIVRGLFDINFNDGAAIAHLVFKSVVIGIIIGALLGVLNMFLKVQPFKRRG
jgi:H+/Cl- antiporter ClcA